MENNHPEKIVIIAGPSFGSAMSFMLLGAALGATGALFYKSRNSAINDAPDAVTAELLGAKTEARSAQLTERLATLSRRVKSLASTAKESAQTVGATALPKIRHAVEEGKKVARGTQEDIRDELENEPDTVYATPSFVEEQA